MGRQNLNQLFNEIRAVLKEDSEFFEAAYGVTAKGNWEDMTVLQRALDNSSLAARFNLDVGAVPDKLAESHAKLLAARSARVRPGTDDKILTAWNGLMLAAFAEAARNADLGPRSTIYLLAATRSAEFLLSAMRPDGRLRRAWRDGKTTDEVFLEDYAALIVGLLELYQTDFNNKWFKSAKDLADEMIQKFSDPAGGFFDTPSDAETLLVRPKDLQDNAVPSGNSLACEALLKLALFTDHGEYRDLAEKSLATIGEMAMRYPSAFARWLSAAENALNSGRQIAVLGEAQEESFGKLIQVVRREYRPGVVVAASPFPPSDDSPALLMDRPLKGGKSTAYVCEGFVCEMPTIDPQVLQAQLKD